MDTLPRRLGLASAIAVLVGSTIGSGIFRSPAGIADKLPGPLPMLAVWIVGGLFALCGALTLAEVGGAYPATGGLYVFLREGWGRLAAFLFGWAQLTVIRAAALGAVALTFSEYFLRFAGFDPEQHETASAWIAAFAIALTAATNYAGMRWGVLVQNITTIVKYSALVVLVLVASAVALPEGTARLTPAIPPGSFALAPFGLALVSVLWAFDGWADLCFVAGEVKEPRRNIPRALILGTLAVIAIYVAANIAYLLVLSIDELRTSKLVASDVAERVAGPMGAVAVALAVVISTFGTLNATLITTPRIFFAMANDGLLPRRIGAVHPTHATPHVAIFLCAALGIAFVLARTFEQLADAYVTALVPFYGLAIASIFLLRRREGYDPPFRTPLYPFVPVAFILATIFLLVNAVMEPTTRVATIAVLGVLALGFPVYWVLRLRSA